MTPKQNVVPPNGHHFVDRSSGVEHKIVGHSYQDVAEKLLRYRLANKLPVGSPLTEVYEYVCSTWPHFCDATPQEVVYRTTSEPSFTVAVMLWMSKMWDRQARTPKSLVPDSEAIRRAVICQACPLQKDWSDYGCGSCVSSIRQKGFVFRAGRETGIKGVMGCGVLKQDNTTAVFAHLEGLPEAAEEQKLRLPNGCWRK